MTEPTHITDIDVKLTFGRQSLDTTASVYGRWMSGCEEDSYWEITSIKMFDEGVGLHTVFYTYVCEYVAENC